MNLITEKWIPVLCTNNDVIRIAPHELTLQIDSNPIVKLHASRPDFNGALAQFLVGLLQTALPELSASQWRKWAALPPTSDELKKIFSPLSAHFDLLGDGVRFMQDLDLREGEAKPIAALLIEQPGQQTLEQNADHFIKRDQINGLCPSCAATALFTLQTNAPAGGAGHRTSMRGGGPLTTLLISTNQEKTKFMANAMAQYINKKEI